MAENTNENPEVKKKGRPRKDASNEGASNEGTSNEGTETSTEGETQKYTNFENVTENTSTSEEDAFVKGLREELDKEMGIGGSANTTTADDTANDAQTSAGGNGGNNGGNTPPPDSDAASADAGNPNPNNGNDNPAPDFDPDPLDEEVIQRGYSQTKGTVSEEPIPEPKVSQQQAFNPNE